MSVKYPDPERVNMSRDDIIQEFKDWRYRVHEVTVNKKDAREAVTASDILQLFGPFLMDPVVYKTEELSSASMLPETASIELLGKPFLAAKRLGWDEWELEFPELDD